MIIVLNCLYVLNINILIRSVILISHVILCGWISCSITSILGTLRGLCGIFSLCYWFGL